METKRYFRLLARSFVCATAVLVLATAAYSQSSWQPERNVEIVIPTGPGGGTDRVGRLIQKIWQDNALVRISTVLNRPGGGGTIAWTYLNQYPGDGHYLSIAPLFLLTNHITGRSKLNFGDFTPVALLTSENVAFMVKVDSPIKEGREFAERLRKDPSSLSLAIGGTTGGSNHIALGLLMNAAGGDVKKLKIVVFNSTGESIAALMGGHVDVLTAAANMAARQTRQGKVRVIAVAAPNRLGGDLASAPTWKEQGFDVVADQWRSVIGPSGMTSQQLAFWDEVFSKLVSTEAWKQYLARSLVADNYMNSTRALEFMRKEYETLTIVLGDLGLAKQ
ncbi:MAG: tripartite tricarboxylate transporter substrate binding protein [Betaproteobacteria bacterium]|nr:tripartite tricarboxylate transporter substrate binding protein [Betaproteobacteria bacterium]